jgi:hypothetical protein
MMSSTLRERRLREDVRAMRHLPPGTPLRHPSDPWARALLDDLLALSDDVDPLRWMLDQRESLVACIALEAGLRYLRHATDGFRAVAETGEPIREEYRVLLGSLVTLPDTVPPIAELERESPLSPERLVRLFRQVQALQGGTVESAVHVHDPDDLLGLMLDLLALPVAVDPLRWLSKERGAVAARIALSETLEVFRPVHTLDVGAVVAARRASHVACTPRGVHMSIAELVFGQSGFRFAANVWLSTGTPALRSADDSRVVPLWPGFDRVVDDRTNHYLLKHIHVGTGGYILGWRREHLRMAFYPAVSPAAKLLAFASYPMTLGLIRAVPRGGGVELLPDRDIGNITWEVAVR